jgi:hypothetical protein
MEEKKRFWSLGEYEYKTFDISNKTWSEAKSIYYNELDGYEYREAKIERYGDKVYLTILF